MTAISIRATIDSADLAQHHYRMVIISRTAIASKKGPRPGTSGWRTR